MRRAIPLFAGLLGVAVASAATQHTCGGVIAVWSRYLN